MIDSISYKLRTMYKWPGLDKTLGSINGVIVFALVVVVLSASSYSSGAEFEFAGSHIQKAPEVSSPKKSHDSSTEPESIESALNYLLERLKASESETEAREQAVEQGYILIDFETDDHGWIGAGTGQGKFEIGIPVPFSPEKGECKTACFGTGPSEDHSAIGVNAACTNLDGHMAPLETLYTNSLTSPIYDFSGCSNVTLELWRFMEIEGADSDFCYYQYKNSPTGRWTTFETYGTIEVDDVNWVKYTKDLSGVADGRSHFQLRFYCTTDEWTEGSGLCLDDIMIRWSGVGEPQATGERQRQVQERAEFESESKETTDAIKAEEWASEYEYQQKENHAPPGEPNTIKSALAALLLKLEAYEVTIEKEEELFAPITRLESKGVSRFIGSVYGEIGKSGGTFDEEPAVLNTILGYNVFNTSAEDGIILFPTFRVLLKRNKPEYDWGNYVDYGIGITYQKTPFIIGAEGVYRDNYENDDLGGDFFRVWGDYWNMWETEVSDFLKTDSTRLWGTRYIDFEYDTLDENFITDFNADVNLDLFNFQGFTIGPFAEGTINLDTRDEPWYRYGQVGGGIRIRKGPLHILFETGYRDSFNEGGEEGKFYSVYSGIWLPLN